MDLLLLGAMAVVLIALTLWLVWHPSPESARPEANDTMTPMGDQFEDQYTSATADLSAGGIAVTTANAEEQAIEAPARWPEATIGPEGSTTEVVGSRPRTPLETVVPPAPTPVPRAAPDERPGKPSARTIGMGAAAAVTLGGAAAGAWLYSRWQRQRNTPISRLRRRFR